MKLLFSLLFCTVFLFACNDAPTTKTPEGLASVEFSIEGMSCEKMCGGAICKGLEKLEGVATTDLEFSSDNPVDKVTIEYDTDLVSVEDMKKKVEGLAGGAYAVKSVN